METLDRTDRLNQEKELLQERLQFVLANNSDEEGEKALILTEVEAIKQRIQDIERFISQGRLQKMAAPKRNAIALGSTIEVTIQDVTRTMTIVESFEADPFLGLISIDSPLGKAFLGRKVGDEVEVMTPKGAQVYHIVQIGHRQ